MYNMLDLSQISLNGQNLTGKLAQEIYDEFLVCKICYEAYKNPKCLSCLHTFCEDCIERHISGEVTYNKQTDYHDFTCPLCRKRTQLPLGGVKKLPDNFLISGLNDLVNKSSVSPSVSIEFNENRNSEFHDPQGDFSDQEQQNYEKSDFLTTLPVNRDRGFTKPVLSHCEICSQVPGVDRGRSTTPTRDSKRNTTRARSAHLQTTPNAHSKCLDCNKLLCKECVDRHKSMHVTKSHAIFELASEVQIACTTHPEEMVRFYCQKCNQCVCVLCTFHIHRDHEVINFTEALSYFHEEVNGKFEVLNKFKQQTRNRLESLEKANERIGIIEKSILETSESLKRQIEEDAQDLIRDLHKRIGRINMDAIERRSLLEEEIQSADILRNETEKILDGHEILVLMKRNSIIDKFKVFNSVRNQTSLNDIQKQVYFHPGSVNIGCLSDSSEPPNLEVTSGKTKNSDILHDPDKVVNQTVVKSLLNVSIQTDLIAEKPDKQMRSRGLNTEMIQTEEKETNTHPRGLNVQISFAETSEQMEDNFMQLSDGRIVSKINGEDVNLEEMDNLTRARLRRKFREKGQTLDEQTPASSTLTSPISSTSNIRRTSLYSSVGNSYNARRYRYS